jgi:hypothetical protein
LRQVGEEELLYTYFSNVRWEFNRNSFVI